MSDNNDSSAPNDNLGNWNYRGREKKTREEYTKDVKDFGKHVKETKPDRDLRRENYGTDYGLGDDFDDWGSLV